MGDTMVDTADTTVTVTTASVPLMLSPRPSPRLRPPLSLNPRLRLMPMLGATTDTDTADTTAVDTDTDTVVTDMAVTDTMVNFAQTDQVTRISNPKIRPEQKKLSHCKIPFFFSPL